VTGPCHRISTRNLPENYVEDRSAQLGIPISNSKRKIHTHPISANDRALVEQYIHQRFHDLDPDMLVLDAGGAPIRQHYRMESFKNGTGLPRVNTHSSMPPTTGDRKSAVRDYFRRRKADRANVPYSCVIQPVTAIYMMQLCG
jgi:hypothetical protein